MKKIVSILSIFAATAAIASSVQSDNTFGVMKLNIGTAIGQTIIGVPWENVGGGEINVNKIMLTNNLAIGDQLWYFNQSTKKFQCWKLEEGGWAAQTVLLENQETTEDSKTVPRGSALIIDRKKEGLSGEVYLYGQYVASTGRSTISAATESSDVYSLIAPSVANTSEVDLNAYTWTGAARGDAISCGTKTYNYDGSGWYYEEAGTGDSVPVSGGSSFKLPTKVTTGITIPAGQGVWYIRAKGGASFTVSW